MRVGRALTFSRKFLGTNQAEVLNRLGYRLRKVVKAKPRKKLKETDAIFDNIKKKTTRRWRQATSNA